MITFLIFLIVLGVLVFVHELGHFLLAKWAGVRVDEFGFGYPPRAYTIGQKWGTTFTLNWIPFGGFVKIFGEDYEEKEKNPPEKAPVQEVPGSPCCTGQTSFTGLFPVGKNFTQVSKKWQAAILAAGVTFNIIFAWLLFSCAFIIGVPTSIENSFGTEVKNPVLTVTGIIVGAPAEEVGLKTGDKIKNVSFKNSETVRELNPQNVSDFINKSNGEILFLIDRGGQTLSFEIEPKSIPTENSSGLLEQRKIIGINMDMVGMLKLPIHKAFYEGARATWQITTATIFGILGLIKDAFKWQADISSIAGPVGIVGLVGDATRLGFVYLLTFTALISINLAIINLMPFPALDGGRLLFVIIESLTKKPVNPKFAGITNTVGFALLIALMLFITYRDIVKLF